MNIKDVEVKLNFQQMLAGVFHDDELVKQFDINAQEPGSYVGWFNWDHENDDGTFTKVKHEIIIEVGQTLKGMALHPTFQIYPIAGNYVIHTSPKKCDVRKGTVEDYYKNHNHYEEDNGNS